MTKREIAKVEKLKRAVQDVVWRQSLASFSQFDQFSKELASKGLQPHEELFLLAVKFLGLLSVSKPEHADAIQTLGEAIAFARELAAANR